MNSPNRAWRGRRSTSGVSKSDVDYEDGLSAWAHGQKLDLMSEGEASWRADPLAHLFGCSVFNGGQEKVLELAEDDAITELGYGGGVGGGKSHAMVFIMLMFMLRYPGWQHWCARKYEKGMGPSCVLVIKNACDWLKANHGLDYKETKADIHEFVLYTGPTSATQSRVMFMGLDNFEIVQGANFDGVWIEEASQMGKQHYVKALERRRGSSNRHSALKERGERWRSPWLGWTANAKQGYINQEFVVRASKGQLGKEPFQNRAFVESRTRENVLLNSDYVKSLLNADPGGAMEAQLDGRWDFEEGFVYHEGDIHKDTFCRFDPETVAGKPMAEIVGDGGYDYGWDHPSVFAWGFVHEGILWVSEEFVRKRCSIKEQAQWAQRFHRQTAWWADQSTQTMVRRSAEMAIMDEFAREGVRMIAANTGSTDREVLLGVARVRDALKRGVIRIDEARCPMLKRAITEWQFKLDRRGNILPDEVGENLKDENDAFRYLILNVENKLRWSVPVAGVVEEKKTGGTSDWLAEKMKAMNEANASSEVPTYRKSRY